jgi:hypothetical protein
MREIQLDVSINLRVHWLRTGDTEFHQDAFGFKEPSKDFAVNWVTESNDRFNIRISAKARLAVAVAR